MMFKIAKNKQLYFLDQQAWKAIDLKPCFPNSHKEKYFSLIDKDGKEIQLLESLELLDSINKKTVREYLNFKSFSFNILGVYKIEEDFGVRHFEVKTAQGDRHFQTNLDDWPKLDDKGEIHIEDLYGDMYQVKDLEFGAKILADYIG